MRPGSAPGTALTFSPGMPMPSEMVHTPDALVLATEPLSAVLTPALEAAGFDVSIHGDATDALEQTFRAQPDLAVLEHGFEDANGADMLTGVRLVSNVPLIVIGHDQAESAAVAALNGGADRYMSLPLRVEEFGATASAILRRARRARVAPAAYSDGALEVDFQTYHVRVHGIDVGLTPAEFRVLAAFVNNAGQTLTTEEILEAAWGHATLPRGRVKLYIGYLRRKFRSAGVDLPIETVRGFGYRYVPTSSDLEALLAQLEDIRGPSGQPFFPTVAARRELEQALGAG